MKSIKDLLQKKADDIDASGVKTDMQLLQQELDRHYEGSLTVNKFKDGTATISTSNASIASNVRMQQTQLIEDLNSSLKNKLDKLIIRIS